MAERIGALLEGRVPVARPAQFDYDFLAHERALHRAHGHRPRPAGAGLPPGAGPGYAWTVGEYDAGIGTVAVPVFLGCAAYGSLSA
ncbi:hypothetical protein FM21_31045 [Streptomyces mutabilis]|uniref:Uncharacterized protein n=1 Tax=Streptomyces mutabilis TaxID=67332 RepID=A0A086MSX9_9ACTN|nr:hypothetical protein FM21_31045 [Streptomyces mutabilis]